MSYYYFDRGEAEDLAAIAALPLAGSMDRDSEHRLIYSGGGSYSKDYIGPLLIQLQKEKYPIFMQTTPHPYDNPLIMDFLRKIMEITNSQNIFQTSTNIEDIKRILF